MDSLRVLVVHNRYRQRGGEDTVFEAEVALLRARGHDVETLEFSNTDIDGGLLSAARTAIGAIYSRQAASRIASATRTHRADVVHFHNTFPLVSPGGFGAARRQGAGVVLTLHNYRLVCPNGLCFRAGHPCEECLGHSVPWPAARYGCYHDSRVQSAAVAAMLTCHRLLRTWSRHVDAAIVLTEFQRTKLLVGPLPMSRVVIKPNFVTLHADWNRGIREGRFLFAGRVSAEKGIPTLLSAWGRADLTDAWLEIAGDGPLKAMGGTAAVGASSIGWLGHVGQPELRARMNMARALVFPSELYETFGMTVVEAFAAGLPVIAAAMGTHGELVRDGETGMLFNPGDPEDLARKLTWAYSHPDEMRAMGMAARAECEAKYGPETNYDKLMTIYQAAIARRRLRAPFHTDE